MKRLFWISTGVALTVFVMAKGRKIVAQYTPSALTERVGEQAVEFGEQAKETATGFLADFKAAAKEREQELRDSLLADSQGSLKDLRARRDDFQNRRPRAQDIFDDDSEDDELGYSF